VTEPIELLVVEDEASVRRALRRVLEHLGHTVTLCPTLAAARATTTRFDVAIFDIELPDGSGIDLAEALIAEGRVGSALFFSGTTDEAARRRAAEVGRFVEKRGGTQELVSALLQELGEQGDVRLAACAEGDSRGKPGSIPPDTVTRRKPR
jgi:DNA-binding response OmpR family regulator